MLVVAAASVATIAPAYAGLGGAPTYPVTASSTSAGAASQSGAAVARYAASANAAAPAYTEIGRAHV